MSLLFALPGFGLVIIFALIERKYDLQKTPEEDRVVHLDALYLAVALSVLGTSALIYLVLVTQIFTIDDIATMIFATVIVWHILTRIDFGNWIIRHLLRGG